MPGAIRPIPDAGLPAAHNLEILRNMRTPLLAGLIAVLIPACMSGISGVGDDDDTVTPGGSCGNGAVDSGEECDDGNTASGDGCSAACATESATPRVTASVDKMTVTTELAKTETVTVTYRSLGGFAGDVTIANSLVDATNAPFPAAITVTGPATITLAADATQTAQYQIVIPMNATGATLNGTLKLAGSSSLGAVDISSTVTVNNIYTVDYTAGTGDNDALHTNTGNTPNLKVKRGAILRFHNGDTADHIIHGGGVFPHEGQVVGVDGLPGRNYDVQTIGITPGSSGTLGCHTHGTATYSTYTVE